MYMNLIIHFLEIAVALLSIALGVQISRQYKAGEAVQNAATVKDVVAKRSARAAALPQTPNIPQFTATPTDVVEDVASVETVTKPAAQILDDYIGTFFDDLGSEPVGESMYVSGSKESAVEEGHQSHIESVAPAVDLSQYKVSSIAAAEESIPVLNKPIPESLITEKFIEQVRELDNEVIVVEEKDVTPESESIMSDKVVLAMLDEAKLVGSH